MLEPEKKTLGQIAYEAYYHSVESELLPQWIDVEPKFKVAWEYSTTTVIQVWLEESKKASTSSFI